MAAETKPAQEWVFVVDTEQYAGNFEREMVAYMTGMIGDCEVGDEAAQKFYEEMGLNDNWDGVNVAYCAEDFDNPFALAVTSRSDEHGCRRPASIWPTPGWFNHGMGGHFREGQEEQAATDYKAKCLEYSEERVHPNDREAHQQRWEERSKQPLQKHPAYLSVAVFFSKRPTDEQIEIMRERAKKFAEDKLARFVDEEITITGFRLLREETQTFNERNYSP